MHPFSLSDLKQKYFLAYSDRNENLFKLLQIITQRERERKTRQAKFKHPANCPLKVECLVIARLFVECPKEFA